jgi:hypothetical protein
MILFLGLQKWDNLSKQQNEFCKRLKIVDNIFEISTPLTAQSQFRRKYSKQPGPSLQNVKPPNKKIDPPLTFTSLASIHYFRIHVQAPKYLISTLQSRFPRPSLQLSQP